MKEEVASDYSSPNDTSNPEVTTSRSTREDVCFFIDDSTLVFKHFGPRVIMLSDNDRTLSRSKTMNRTIELSRSSSIAKGFARGNSPAHISMSYADTRQGVQRRKTRYNDRQEVLLNKYNFTPDELSIYEEFSRLLTKYEPDEMCEILSDVLKDAKN
mmetsp:Transcript_25543/g.44562  ORF Transcript_25543/g.44562 Transcript_25543/m.44562 type:complete len:157 (-) Transcript_25543:4029-4499(-)